MGKKKSVVLMTLITIVLLALCALVAFPRVPVKGGIQKWNPVAMQYDLGAEFAGGHYAYYYPNGVVTEQEYDALTAEEQEEYVAHGSLYLSKAEEDCILEDADGDGEYAVTENFQAAFDKAVSLLSDRFAERANQSGSTYRVAIVDDYAVKVELSATENTKNQTESTYASQAFGTLANMGDVTFEVGDALVDELSDGEHTVGDLIKSVSVKTQYKVSYLKITFTSLGKEMLKNFQDNETITDESGSTTTNTLDLKMGDETLLSFSSEVINSKNQIEYGVSYQEERLNAYTLLALLNSGIENGGVYIENETTPFAFQIPTSSEIRTYAPVYGDVFVWVLVAVLALMVAAFVVAIVKMGGFGVMNLYASLTYFVVTAILFAFVNGGVFVVSMASIFLFLAGLGLMNVLHAYIYNAIKAEVATGKTVVSAVKKGYKKTIWTIVDIYAVLLVGAIALLIGVASLNAFATQAVVCVLTAAFGNLVWGRALNVMLLSASKDKYKYFRFAREEDNDDE